jgi:hypothetical protein
MTFDMSTAAIGFGREALLEGDAETAVGALRGLVSQGRGGHEARYWLASALMAKGESAAGEDMLDQARTMQALELAAQMGADLAQLARDGDYAASVATKLYTGANVAMSSAVWAMAVAAGHRSATGWLTYGLALQHQGRCEEAIDRFRATLEAWPSPGAHQFLLYPHLLVDDRLRRYGAEARAWAQRWAPAGAQPTLARRPVADRKLRIGYVSPAFAATQIHQFIAPVIDAHDREAVEVFLYPAKAEGEEGWRAPTAVRPIGHLSDDEAVALIRSDEIDVLIDCWGHSAGSRIPLFARRCAPVQAAWINFVQTTGVTGMDFLLHAGPQAAPFAHPLFSERIWPIGPVFNVFRPTDQRPPTGPTPALARGGQVTFGSFNHPCKLSDATVAAWARILRGRPQARLLLKYVYFADPVLRRATQARFAAHGVAAERVVFEGRSAGAEYLAAFSAIDVALDPWPAPGSTTTLEALSHGVPVVTYSPPHGDPGDAYGRALVSGAGQPDLAVDDWDAYVALALDLTADLDALNRRRSAVRAGFDTGPLRDEAGFTRRVEAALRGMAVTARGEARSAA